MKGRYLADSQPGHLRCSTACEETETINRTEYSAGFNGSIFKPKKTLKGGTDSDNSGKLLKIFKEFYDSSGLVYVYK